MGASVADLGLKFKGANEICSPVYDSNAELPSSDNLLEHG